MQLRFLVLVPLFLASCSEKQKQDDPMTPEEEIDIKLVASRDGVSNEEDPVEEDSSLTEAMQEKVSEESDASESPANYPEVTPVPGQPGFVYSPFNHQVIDVQGLPSGTLVADPCYPPSEKKYFRVP